MVTRCLPPNFSSAGGTSARHLLLVRPPKPSRAIETVLSVHLLPQERSRHRAREGRYHGLRLSWIVCSALVLWCSKSLRVVSPATHVTAIRRPTQIVSTYSHISCWEWWLRLRTLSQ